MKLNEAESFPFLFHEGTKDCFLYQHVTEPTRFRGNQVSLLDLIFTNEEVDVKKIENLSPLGKSDHGVVMCDVICEWKTNAFFIPKRLYHKGNYEQMNILINEVNWEDVFAGLNIHQRWELFKRKQEEFAKQCIPETEPKRYKTPWMKSK